jgi:hypothetical protein
VQLTYSIYYDNSRVNFLNSSKIWWMNPSMKIIHKDSVIRLQTFFVKHEVQEWMEYFNIVYLCIILVISVMCFFLSSLYPSGPCSTDNRNITYTRINILAQYLFKCTEKYQIQSCWNKLVYKLKRNLTYIFHVRWDIAITGRASNPKQNINISM